MHPKTLEALSPPTGGCVSDGGGGAPPRCANVAMSNLVSVRALGVRIAIVCISTSITIFVPFFGLIVAIIGSFSVSILSFVLPSAMHLACASGCVHGRGRAWQTLTPEDTSGGGSNGGSAAAAGSFWNRRLGRCAHPPPVEHVRRVLLEGGTAEPYSPAALHTVLARVSAQAPRSFAP